jgi:Family of unknown function (DUF6338)
MDQGSAMPTFTSTDVLYFLAFVVPGFISMQIYGQIRPRQRTTLKDNFLEAVSFGAINFLLLFFPIIWIMKPENFQQHPIYVWLATICIFLICPSAWPWAMIWVQNILARWHLFLSASPTAWDHFFGPRKPCWVLVHISETRRVGGWFGKHSFASSYPEPGHLYIEELWEIGEDGGFLQKQDQSRGILLRPSDYQMVEFFED